MAKYSAVNGVYRKVEKKYDPVDGVYRNVKAAFEPVNGVYRQYFRSGIPASELAVGDSVWLNVDGVLKEFLVVHQGKPEYSAYQHTYDENADGTWLLMRETYGSAMAFDDKSANFASSDIKTYLNETFHKLLDSHVQDAINNARIPVSINDGTLSTVLSTSVSVKWFLLSMREIGYTTGTPYSQEGGVLDYFKDATADKRIAYSGTTAITWWLRSVSVINTNNVYFVSAKGATSIKICTSAGSRVRPACVLNSNTLITQSDGINIIE